MTRIPRLASVIGGRYELETLLGEGGMAQVWQARHPVLGMPVAVKLLYPRLISNPTTRERFLTEAKVMAALDTRHAVRVFDSGITADGQPYLVMDLVDGETLGGRLARERLLSPAVTVRVLGQCAKALDRAHALGIVHRDFKPDNVMLARDEDGQLLARVGDFGVAKLLSSSRWETAAPAENEGTSPRDFAGTPVYMAPEQLVHGGDATPAVDVWAFGVVAYELLTGRVPFKARDLHALGRRVAACAHTPPSQRRPGLPKAFDGWFSRACSVAPAQRFPTVRLASEALALALGVAEEGAPAASKRGSRRQAWVVAAGVTIAASAILWSLAPRPALPLSTSAPVVGAESAAVAPPRDVPRETLPLDAPPPPAKTTLSARLPLRRASLPEYRSLPDDEPPRAPPRGFKHDPY